jgi:hypothetical protein
MNAGLLFQNRDYTGVPGGKINILEGHNVGHSMQKYVYIHVSLPNGFRDRTISLYGSLDAHRRATRHVLIRVAKCIDVDGGIFENVLY